MRVGHIGWLSNDQDEFCETVAWCDIDTERLQKLGREAPETTLYSDYREMLHHPGLDLVVISTPNWLHCEMACAFLGAGKHVFLEKPMGINRDEMDGLLRAAEASGKNLAIDFEMRASRFAQRIKHLLTSGELGELRRMECIHHRGGWLEEDNGIWRTRPEKSGGLYLMEPIHTVDVFRFLGGEIDSVQTVSGPNVLTNYRFPDNTCSHFFFKSGVLGTLLTNHTLSAYAPDSADWARLGHDMNMIFTCSKGAIAVDLLRARILINRYETYPKGTNGTRVVFDREEDYSSDGPDFFHDIRFMRMEFIRRCAHGLPLIQEPLDAWKTHLVCLAAEESAAQEGRRITVDYSMDGAVV